MRLRNQRGCLRCTRRKTGPSCWEFLWRENDSDGNRTRRTAVIGTVDQFPTRDLAEVAVNSLRVCINQHRIRQREQSIVVADLVDHYIQTELSDEADWHSHATRIVYSEFLKRWVRPQWADMGKRYDFRSDPAPYLNRHGILHGRIPDYATRENSTRVFLLTDAIADLWLEKQRTLANVKSSFEAQASAVP